MCTLREFACSALDSATSAYALSEAFEDAHRAFADDFLRQKSLEYFGEFLTLRSDAFHALKTLNHKRRSAVSMKECAACRNGDACLEKTVLIEVAG